MNNSSFAKLVRETALTLLLFLSGVLFFLITPAMASEPAFVNLMAVPKTNEEAETARAALQAARSAETVILSQTLSTQSLSSTSGLSAGQVVPDVDALARALKYDVNLMYAYVHDNIEFEAQKGLIRGAVGTIRDGHGTAFDQAQLLFELLQASDAAAGTDYQPKFVIGDITLSDAQFETWFGIGLNYIAVNNYLGTAGFSGSLGGDVNTGVTSVTIDHVWLKVKVGGNYVYLDPSFKEHSTVAGIDLTTKMEETYENGGYEYSTSDFLTSAKQGATYSSNYSIKDVNYGAIRNNLENLSIAMAGDLLTNFEGASLDEIVGGRKIVADTRDASSATPPYTINGTPPEYSSIPDTDRILFSVGHVGISKNFYVDEIYGKRLVIHYVASGGGVAPQLVLDGTILGTGNVVTDGTNQNVRYDITYPTYRSNFSVVNYFQSIVAGSTYLIANSWGAYGQSHLQNYRQLLKQAKANNAPDDSEEVLGNTLAMIASNYLGQAWSFRKISNSIADTIGLQTRIVGIVGYRGSPYIDLPLGSGFTIDKNTGDMDFPGIFTNGGIMSVHESGAIEQTQNVDAVSTVRIIHDLNSQGMKIYDARKSNWSSVRANITGNYSTASLDNIEAALQSSDASQTYRYILPEDGSLAFGDWQGSAHFSIHEVFATQNTSASIGIGYIIGDMKGGYAQSPVSASALVSNTSSTSVSAVQEGGQASLLDTLGDPVVAYTGAYSYSHDDLSIGSSGFPYGLGFQRSYNSDARAVDGPMGLGWKHNYQITATVDSNGFQGLGEDSALDAVPAIVALYVAHDLFSSSMNLDHFVVATLVQNWYMEQLKDNAVNVSLPNLTEQFIKRYKFGGIISEITYTPPPGSGSGLYFNAGEDYFIYSQKDRSSIVFNTNGDIAYFNTSKGVQVSFEYDASDRLTKVSNNLGSRGRYLSFEYDSNDRITDVITSPISYATDPFSGEELSPLDPGQVRKISYQYDSVGNLTKFTTYNEGFPYDDPSQSSSPTLEATETVFGYDEPGRLQSIKYPSFPSTNFVYNVYDSLGRVKQQTNARGKIWKYYVAGTRTEEENPDGYSKITYFNGAGRTTRFVDEEGRETRTLYDNQNRVSAKMFPEGNFITYGYDSKHNPVLVTAYEKCADGTVAETCLQQFEDCVTGVSCSRSSIVSTQASYDLYSQVEWTKDAKGNQTDYTYDANGNITKVQAPAVTVMNSDGSTSSQRPTTEYSNYSLGRPGTVTVLNSPENIVTTYDYETLYGDLEKVTLDANGENLWTQYTYDHTGNATVVSRRGGNTAQSIFDTERRVKSVSYTGPGFDLGKGSEGYTYDKDGRLLTKSVCNRRGEPLIYVGPGWIYGCDETSTVVTNVYLVNGQLDYTQDALGNRITYGYDNVDRVLTVTDGENRRARTVYDHSGRVLHSYLDDLDTADAEQRQRSNSYSDNGLLLSVTDARNNVTSYDYDGFGRLLKTIYPDGSYAQNSNIDNNGNIGTVRLRNGQQVTFTYDSLNRPTLKNLPGSEPDVSYKFDRAGRMRQVADSSQTITYTYDVAGRVLTAGNSGHGKTVSYGYGFDTDGFTYSTVTYPGNFTLTYTAGNGGDQDIITDGSANVLATINYDYRGLRTDAAFNNSATSLTYSHNNAMALTSMAHTFNGSSVTFNYDRNDVYQIEGITPTNTDYLWKPQLNVNIDYSSNSVNQYSSAWNQTISYDANGNMTKAGRDELTYDSQNRLMQAKMPSRGTDTTYSYGPENRRYQKNVDGSVTAYVYSGGNVIAEYSGFGAGATLLRRYVYGPGTDELLGKIEYNANGTEASRVFYQTDHQGSVIAEVNASGAVTEKFAYSPFGASNDEITGNVYRYTGRRFDAETGLYYYRARYYSTELGRFLSPDPIGYGDGLNMYAYVGNDPLNGIDPSGLFGEIAGKAFSLTASYLDECYEKCAGINYFTGSSPSGLRAGTGWLLDAGGPITDPGTYMSISSAIPPAALVGEIFTGLRAYGTLGRSVSNISRTISYQKQARHIAGHSYYRKGGTLNSVDDAQKILDAYHSSNVRLLGTNAKGYPVVQYNGVTGTNINPGAGFIDQPTNVFMIKGTQNPSVVPVSPNWTPPS